MKWLILILTLGMAGGGGAPPAVAFCGFYVASGDAKIYNHASKVVITRDRDRTVLTMVSDYQGDPKEFAVVIPVPVVLQKGQVHVGDPAWVDHLDAYSAPRLVEYHDPDPCPQRITGVAETHFRGDAIGLKAGAIQFSRSSAVTVRAQFKVDEYEIVILSATEGRGLDRWLKRNGYRVPAGAAPVLSTYIKQGLYFFVAKVNIAEQQRRGYNYLRPIQVAYESPKFMLPIRLGMVNSEGTQEMFVFTLTRGGRVESTNYRTVRLPTGQDVPEFVKREFPDFTRRLYTFQHERQGQEAIFTEYVWVIVPNTPSCDPCSAPYLTPAELRSLGAYWVQLPPNPPGEVVLTRLHLRYDRAHFPEDLQLQLTADRENWQARYVIHHPYRGSDECPELAAYRKSVWDRREHEAENYCDLTNSSLDETRAKMGVGADWAEADEAMVWWERFWPTAAARDPR